LYMITGEPLQGKTMEQLQLFLQSCQLDTDPALDFTVLLMEEDAIIATGSLCGNTIRCVAVAPTHQGEDLTAQVMTPLMQHAFQQGIKHLLVYTKPHNQHLFSPFGFYPVIRTADCLLMENRRGGLDSFLASLCRPEPTQGPVGSIVMNGNPFTHGHRYLIETAAAQCAHVHVFVLSEDKGLFTPNERLRMAQSGCRDLKNVSVHPTGPYMVSSATFPSYFIKDKLRTGDIHCQLDVRLFGEKIAPALHITRRYVGTEPGCPVTRQYNDTLRRLLPACGVELIEIPRREALGEVISASRVRTLIAQKNFSALAAYLPQTTLDLIDHIKGEFSCRIPSECSET